MLNPISNSIPDDYVPFAVRLPLERQIKYQNAVSCGHCGGTGAELYPPKNVHCVYRHYGPDGTLLYVGITGSFVKRQSAHSSRSFWWILVTAITVESYANRDEAELAEQKAIVREKPLFNRDIGKIYPVKEETLKVRWLEYSAANSI